MKQFQIFVTLKNGKILSNTMVCKDALWAYYDGCKWLCAMSEMTNAIDEKLIENVEDIEEIKIIEIND